MNFREEKEYSQLSWVIYTQSTTSARRLQEHSFPHITLTTTSKADVWGWNSLWFHECKAIPVYSHQPETGSCCVEVCAFFVLCTFLSLFFLISQTAFRFRFCPCDKCSCSVQYSVLVEVSLRETKKEHIDQYETLCTYCNCTSHTLLRKSTRIDL